VKLAAGQQLRHELGLDQRRRQEVVAERRGRRLPITSRWQEPHTG
jgi:hypothetical protein